MTLVSSVQRARVTKAVMKWDVGDTCCNSSVSAKFALPLNSRNDVMMEVFTDFSPFMVFQQVY